MPVYPLFLVLLFLGFVAAGCDDGGGGPPADTADVSTDSGIDIADSSDSNNGFSECDTGLAPDEAMAINLIPVPQELAVSPGCFALSNSTAIVSSDDTIQVGELLAAALRPATGFALDVRTGVPGVSDVSLVLDDELAVGAEGYTLEVSADGVEIRAKTAAGLFYGCQTLRLLLPHEIESDEMIEDMTWRVPIVEIRDWPRFTWRGTMLDIARHFFGPDDLREHIDMIALHKLNRFHLHLTDDQGWRIEIRSWPDLTTIGGATEVGGTEGGFLTQEEYSELVAYAAERFITVIPEIDMPGHTNAALTSYGELNEDGEATEPYTDTRVGFSSLWLDGEITYRFVEDVLGEVADLTPGPWVHIGGDESRATDPEDYVEFIRWVQGVLDNKDKILIGWDEIAEAELRAGFLGQYWIGPERAVRVAETGGTIISSPSQHAYLDMKYDVTTPVGHIWAGLIDTQVAYEWEPVPEGVDESAVEGLEGLLWTETTESWNDVELLVWPRLAGHSELSWSAADALDWEDYRVRLGAHGERLDALDIGYWPSPLVDWADSD